MRAAATAERKPWLVVSERWAREGLRCILLGMKIRDSGMPDEHSWERLFDARHVLRQLRLTRGNEDVVDFGCGYGTFSIAAARMTKGTIYALDIDPNMVAQTACRA